MSPFFESTPLNTYLVPLLLVLALLVIWLLYRRRQGPNRKLRKALKGIAFEYAADLIVPNGDEGEIHIDHVLLTAEGLLIIDVKAVQGIVFGSDKMQDWTVIASDRRFTFGNPQPAMLDRVAAVRQITRDVPVSGKILFLDGAEFSKGTPSMVCDLDGLLAEFSEADAQSATSKIEAFRPHWEALLAAGRLDAARP